MTVHNDSTQVRGNTLRKRMTTQMIHCILIHMMIVHKSCWEANALVQRMYHNKVKNNIHSTQDSGYRQLSHYTEAVVIILMHTNLDVVEAGDGEIGIQRSMA